MNDENCYKNPQCKIAARLSSFNSFIDDVVLKAKLPSIQRCSTTLFRQQSFSSTMAQTQTARADWIYKSKKQISKGLASSSRLRLPRLDQEWIRFGGSLALLSFLLFHMCVLSLRLLRPRIFLIKEYLKNKNTTKWGFHQEYFCFLDEQFYYYQ